MNNTGQILKCRAEVPFAQIPNSMLRDARLSMKAKGLLSFFLSLPPDWVIYKKSLSKYFNDGYTAISNAWDELEKNGYILSVRKINNLGQFEGWNHIVYYEPQVGKPEDGKPELGKSDDGEPDTTNKEYTKKELTKKESVVDSPQISPEVIIDSPQTIEETTNNPPVAPPPPSQSVKDAVIQCVEYLNQMTGSRYRANTPETQRLLKTLLKNYSIDEIKDVIRKKVHQWKSDPKMCEYLRPSTLFGSKFESYLNSPDVKPATPEVSDFDQKYPKEAQYPLPGYKYAPGTGKWHRPAKYDPSQYENKG
jgi:uncharacterized phage protein (TIGR02220 family)